MYGSQITLQRFTTELYFHVIYTVTINCCEKLQFATKKKVAEEINFINDIQCEGKTVLYVFYCLKFSIVKVPLISPGLRYCTAS
jgi:hypothetical protein